MKVLRLLRGSLVVLACFGLMTAQLARAAGPATTRTAAVRDVALQSSGILKGQILSSQGIPQAGAKVAAIRDGKAVAVAQADQEGHFTLASLSGGVYEIQTADSSGVYRLWAPRTAPPAAQDGVLLVGDENVARGQANMGFLANPWVLAGIVAAAIAIPLATSDSDSGS